MTAQMILFLGLGLVAVASALGMLFSRNAIYSALFLILNFATVAVFYLQLNAPFIALAQVTVYAGAIMVLFLFVIMLLGAEQSGRQQTTTRWGAPLALILAAVLLIEATYTVLGQRGSLPAPQALPEGFGSPVAVGELLFTSYLLPFEITSVLLLVAMVGAITLTISAKKTSAARRKVLAERVETLEGRGDGRQPQPEPEPEVVGAALKREE